MDELLQIPENQEEINSLKFETLKEKEELDEFTFAGTTANVLLISGKDLYIANAGDSRSVLCENGVFIELSSDHKPDKKEEKERINKAGGVVLKGRINGDLSVSRAIGDFDYKNLAQFARDEQVVIATPEITHRGLVGGSEFILMGCDGIWETKTVEKIMKIVGDCLKKQKGNLRRVVEKLFDILIAKDPRGFFIFYKENF